jgi:oligopeptide/dipeptide ABC transporter ATP-binding protein
MQPMTALLEVDDLVVDLDTRNGPVRAVDGVSLSIAAGETLAVIGESGSGKSVTARAVMGLLPAYRSRTTGVVRLGGRVLAGTAARASCGTDVAMVFQDSLSALNPVMTVGWQIAELARVRRGMRRGAARALAVEMLRRVGIPDAERRARAYPHEFSGGMRQRVVIAMALVLGPRLLIADEPTTALDVTVQAQILDLLRRLCAEDGMSLMLISHDLGVVAGLADRVAIMYSGRIVESGPVREVYENAAHPYTRALLASTPGEVAPGDRLRGIPGSPPSPRERPTGCAFQPRCEWRVDRCAEVVPPLRRLESADVACHRAEEVRHAS